MSHWSDDSWRDGYDAWKLASPDDEREPGECYHEEFDIDFEGRAHCDACGQAWWATNEEIRFQREHQAEYDAWCARQERRDFIKWLTYPIRWPIFRLMQLIWSSRSAAVLYDEEIPF